MKIKRAVVSVSSKAGLSDLALFLTKMASKYCRRGHKEISGKHRCESHRSQRLYRVSGDHGWPVKTLHPKVHGGILNIRDNEEHQKAMKAHGISHIDMIVVNLYPFIEVVSKGCTFEDAIENIDIGGPS